MEHWNISLIEIEQSEDEWSFQSSDDDANFWCFWAFLGVALRLQIFDILFVTYPNAQFNVLAIITKLHNPQDAS